MKKRILTVFLILIALTTGFTMAYFIHESKCDCGEFWDGCQVIQQ